MVSQAHIQKLHETFLGLKKEIKKLREETGRIVPGDGKIAPIYVRMLFDGNNSLCSTFVSDACADLNVKVKFEYLPITKSIDEDLPLILISDDTEIDNETAARLDRRKRTDAPTFPLIIFSDDYFILREGESLAYAQTCDTLREKSERPIMPFRRQDLFKQRDIFSMYVECIAQITTLYDIRKSLESVNEELISELEAIRAKYAELPNDGDMENMLDKLPLNVFLVALAGSCLGNKGLIERIGALIDKLDGFVNSLHEEYDRHIDSIITHKTTRNSSAYSVAIDLKYGVLNGYLKKLCTEAEREFSREEFSISLSGTVSNTRSALDSKAAELAFIGTFSSGKTTLINALLGHKHKLRTSGAHNTAVLMELVYAQNEEHYEIVHKDTLKWDIIQYNSNENKSIVNTFDCNARVISVEKNKFGFTIIRYQAVKGNEVRVAKIGGGHTLAVVKGSVVRSNESFINRNVDKNTVRLCSLNELNYIEKLIASDGVSDIKLSTLGGTIRSLAQIRQIIARLKPFYSNSKRNCTQPTVNIEKIKGQWGSDFSKIEECTFECKLFGFKNQSFELDDTGWDNFMGNEEKGMDPFCESPACYMPANEVRVFLNSEFLKYCSITDTPGFGSITDKHDSITGHYLRDSSGKLVVMISVNNHWNDMKLDDLLLNISGIFNDYRKNHAAEICFVLNCFTNLLPFEECKKAVKKIQDKIRTLGFINNEIYVDNLKQVLDSNTEKRVFIEPFPSYYSFKSKCLGDYLNESIDKRYKKLQDNWIEFFDKNTSWLENRINGLTQTLSSKESRILELKNTIRQLETVYIDSGESLISDMRKLFDEYFDNFDSAFKGNRKGIFVHHRWEAVNAIFKTFKEENKIWEEEEEALTDRMAEAFERLSFYARESESEKIDFKPSHRLIVATFEKIYSKLSEANDNTHWFNKSKQSGYYMSQLKDIINQDKEQTISNIRNYCRIYKQKFDDKKWFLLNSFIDELEKSSDREALENDISRFKELQGRLHTFRKKHFDVIEFIN